MAAIKIQKFLGEAPKISPELLPDAAAQITSNAKVYSGDLIPYRQPLEVGNVGRSGAVQSIYPMTDYSDGSLKWLSWMTDVDVASATSLAEEEQRIYYTGNGKPKVTNYAMAVQGAGPYPFDSYDLGLPLPAVKPAATAVAFTTTTTATYSRDSANIATLTTTTPHGLRTGNKVTVTGFTSTGGKEFNATNVEVTVTSDSEFTYFNVGAATGATADTLGRVALAGDTLIRNYVYTWVTPWGEESIPSDPSVAIYVKEGQSVTVSSLPTAKPDGDNFITGIRLYRTVASSSGTEYFRLKTIWFPLATTKAKRVSNTVTLTTAKPHNVLKDDKVRVTGIAFGGIADTSFNVNEGVVTEVVDDYSFNYVASGVDKVETGTTAGTLYWDVSEPETSYAARFYTANTFTDDFDVNGLFQILTSSEYDAPDPAMAGLINATNNMLVGFVENELCFSEPGKPWAWPTKYRLLLEHRIVGLSSVAGAILVLTEKYPYLVTGSTPGSMSTSRIDAPYPCTSKRSIANISFGTVYATYGGLAVYSPSSGIDLITKFVHDWDTWSASLDPTTVVAAFYAGKYFAAHSGGGFIFEREDKIGGFFVSVPAKFSAAHFNAQSNKFYYVADVNGTLLEWDNPLQPLQPLEWKSKVIVTKDYLNLGAARVIADFATPDAESDLIAAFNATVPAHNQGWWDKLPELGTINGPSSYLNTDTSTWTWVDGALNSYEMNGDPVTEYLRTIGGVFPVTFRLWANKQLVADVTISDDQIFRLPAGYRADTFEVSVSGSARIRSIHIGETPYGLRSA